MESDQNMGFTTGGVALHGLVVPQSYTGIVPQIEFAYAEEPASVKLTIEEMNTVARLTAYPPPPTAELLELFGCEITVARRAMLKLKKWWYNLWFSAA